MELWSGIMSFHMWLPKFNTNWLKFTDRTQRELNMKTR